MKIKSFGVSETKLFHFHGILKLRAGSGGSSESSEPRLNPPLHTNWGLETDLLSISSRRIMMPFSLNVIV